MSVAVETMNDMYKNSKDLPSDIAQYQDQTKLYHQKFKSKM